MVYSEITGYGGIQAFFFIAMLLSAFYADSILLLGVLAVLWIGTTAYQVWMRD